MRAVMVCRSCSLSKCRGMVGVAGFEPATWSTQNSRATRLRYTPRGCRPTPEPLDTRFVAQQQADASHALCALWLRFSARLEDRSAHAIAGRNAELLGGSADHFQHR